MGGEGEKGGEASRMEGRRGGERYERGGEELG